MSTRQEALDAQLAELLVPAFVDPPEREPWMDDARCAEGDPEAFFPEKGGSTRDAKRVCAGCLVAEQCLSFALANDERFGIWGGKSERERRKLRGPRAVPQRATVQRDGKTWRAWTDDELVSLRRWNAEQLTDSEIGRRLGRAQSTVSRKRSDMGLPNWGRRG